MPFSTPVIYDDLSGAIGNPQTNFIYLVEGRNAATQSAGSKRVGEFDFELAAGD